MKFNSRNVSYRSTYTLVQRNTYMDVNFCIACVSEKLNITYIFSLNKFWYIYKYYVISLLRITRATSTDVERYQRHQVKSQLSHQYVPYIPLL